MPKAETLTASSQDLVSIQGLGDLVPRTPFGKHLQTTEDIILGFA